MLNNILIYPLQCNLDPMKISYRILREFPQSQSRVIVYGKAYSTLRIYNNVKNEKNHIRYISEPKLNSNRRVLFFSTNVGIDTDVEFKHLPFSDDYIRRLNRCGLFKLKLFQYIISKKLIDDISIYKGQYSLKLILYNEPYIGQTIGCLIPLLYIYSLPKFDEGNEPSNPAHTRPHEPLVFVTSSSSKSHKLLSLILSIQPLLKAVVFDDKHGTNKNCINEDFPFRSDSFVYNLKTMDSYDIIIISKGKLGELLEMSNSRSKITENTSTIVFDDLSENISNNLKFDVFATFLKCSKSVNVIGITNSLPNNFTDYSKKYLSNFQLYDLKNGTSQRLVADRRLDLIKLEVELGSVPDVIDKDIYRPNPAIEHSICKVTNIDRAKILKHLVHLYLDVPTFMLSQCIPKHIKNPVPKGKCIIFVSNRRQLKYLVSLPGLSERCVYLGRDLDVYERSKALSNFKSGIKPIMVATDASIYGCNFDDIKFIFNYHPPNTIDLYKSRFGIVAKNINPLCITLYDKLEYQGLMEILKNIGKNISLHVVPSDEYIFRHDLKWLKHYISNIINENTNLISLYRPKAEELLVKYDDNIINKCIQMIIGMKANVLEEESVPLYTSSLLTGKPGYTAVILTDTSRQLINDDMSVMKFIEDYKSKTYGKFIGKYYKIENGYIIDVNNKHISHLKDVISDNPDLSIQIATSIPKLVLDAKTTPRKIYSNVLPWHSLKSRKLPTIKYY